eukprot:4900421-Amphidinium_carterae.1
MGKSSANASCSEQMRHQGEQVETQHSATERSRGSCAPLRGSGEPWADGCNSTKQHFHSPALPVSKKSVNEK